MTPSQIKQIHRTSKQARIIQSKIKSKTAAIQRIRYLQRSKEQFWMGPRKFALRIEGQFIEPAIGLILKQLTDQLRDLEAQLEALPFPSQEFPQ